MRASHQDFWLWQGFIRAPPLIRIWCTLSDGGRRRQAHLIFKPAIIFTFKPYLDDGHNAVKLAVVEQLEAFQWCMVSVECSFDQQLMSSFRRDLAREGILGRSWRAGYPLQHPLLILQMNDCTSDNFLASKYNPKHDIQVGLKMTVLGADGTLRSV